MDISIISGQMALLHVRLEPGDGFEVYGGTSEDALRVMRQDDEWLVTLDEADVAGRPLVRFNVYARQVSTGREWAIFGGKVLVSQRTATVPGDKLAPVEYFVTVPVLENAVDLTGTAIVTGIVGPRGYSAYEVAVLEGFVGTEAEWLESIRQKTAELAVEQVTPLMERAEAAADKSESKAAAAKTEQETAAAHAKAAKESELAAAGNQTAAAGEVTKAAAEVTKAAAEVNKAKLEREAAAGHANAAAKSAQDALANKQSAEQAAQDAAQAQEGAEAAKTDADAAKIEAQTAERNAKASATQAAADKTAAEQAKTDAQAAQSKAEAAKREAEAKAALLGDAALKTADNEFSGANAFSGKTSVTGDVFFGEGMMSKLCGAGAHMFDWVTSREDIEMMGVDLATVKEFFYATPNLEHVDGYSLFPYINNVTYLVYFNNRADGGGKISKLGGKKEYNGGEEDLLAGLVPIPKYTGTYIFIYPEATTAPKCFGSRNGGNNRAKKWVVYAPKLSQTTQLANDFVPNEFVLVAPLFKQLTEGSLFGRYANRVFLIKANFYKNQATEVDFRSCKNLTTLLSGFPCATKINFQTAILDKESTMRVLNDLLTYDSATMSAVPTLTLGIDTALDGDEEINAALLNAQEAVENGGKGWNVAVSGFTITPAEGVATMGLRRLVYVKRWQDAEGGYIDADGVRWDVRWGNTVLENWQANEELGYEAFPSVEAALEEWGLTEWRPEGFIIPEEDSTDTE